MEQVQNQKQQAKLSISALQLQHLQSLRGLYPAEAERGYGRTPAPQYRGLYAGQLPGRYRPEPERGAEALHG